ncbi:unnamed protein product [Echinostoma caproni]|uniref:EGF-like domain-containing protein n=1 Tax=Echinostoma caproni TaxID=27848 RepID=A0A183AHJ0_9TREM|nr:unnamed protein product [Echinostoma caproni]
MTEGRVYRIQGKLYEGATELQWHKDFSNTQSALFRKFSSAVESYVYEAVQHSGAKDLRNSVVVFLYFKRGSVYANLDLETSSTNPIATEELANYLYLGSMIYASNQTSNSNQLVWFGNRTVPTIFDVTPRTSCKDYASTCPAHSHCADTLNGYLCLCNTMWRDANPHDPGKSCILSVGAIVLIVFGAILGGSVLSAIILSSIYVKRFNQL